MTSLPFLEMLIAVTCLLQCKVLHGAYLTNAKLVNIFPDRSDACYRCKQSPAYHLYIFWSCPWLTDFCSNVFDTLNNALNIDLGPNPLTVFLHFLET